MIVGLFQWGLEVLVQHGVLLIKYLMLWEITADKTVFKMSEKKRHRDQMRGESSCEWLTENIHVKGEKRQNGAELRRDRIGNTGKYSHYHYYDNFVFRLITEIQMDRWMCGGDMMCVCLHVHMYGSALRTFHTLLYKDRLEPWVE